MSDRSWASDVAATLVGGIALAEIYKFSNGRKSDFQKGEKQMVPLLIGGLLAAGGGYVAYKKGQVDGFTAGVTQASTPVTSPSPTIGPGAAPPGAPVAGLPTSGPGAPVGITPPGVAQTGLIVALPPVQVVPDALHDAAASAIQSIVTSGVLPTYSAPIASLQSAYNATKPKTPLAVDGVYTTKSQAVLQSIITPAVAPHSGTNFLVVTPANPAAPPNPTIVTDVGRAAADLMTFFGRAAKKGSLPQVSTFQAAYNAHTKNQPVVVNGQYNGPTEVALQSVLNWSGAKLTAPKNLYLATTRAVPTFQP